MSIETRVMGGARVFIPEESLDDAALQELDAALAEAGAEAVVLDLSRLQYINSHGISIILSAWRRTRRLGGSFALTAPRGAVRKLFELTRISSFVETRGTVDEAVTFVTTRSAPDQKKG